ncbi:MAG TPA: MFS transporter [Frankiaceae bacterium]|nr:MFS transporter [Frankiaceae bacterium]
MTRSLVPPRMRGLPRAVWVLVAGTLITRAGSFAIPFMTIYLYDDRGLSLRAAGVALAAYGAGGMVAALSGGMLADRLGRKPVVVGSPLLGGLSVIGLLISQRPAVVVLVAFLGGIVSESGRPAVSAMLTDLTPPERRIDAFALFRLVINLGFAVGVGLGGLMITHYGFARLFVADALTSWVYAVVALALLPETRPLSPTAPGAPARGFRAVVADRVMRRYWLGTFVAAVVFCQPMATLALALRARGMETAVYGALISLNGLVIIAAEFWLSGRSRRYAPHRVMALAALLIGGGFALTGAVGTSLPLLAGTVVIWTVGEMLGSPTGQAYLAAIAPPDLRGRYAGAVGLAWSLAFTVGPIVGTSALAFGHGAYWLGSLALGMVAAALFMTLPAVAGAAGDPAIPPGLPERPGDAAPVPPGVAVPDEPRGRLLPRFARPRS